MTVFTDEELVLLMFFGLIYARLLLFFCHRDRGVEWQRAVNEQERLCGPGSELPSICLALRAGINGTSDPWPQETVVEYLMMLRWRLNEWREPATEQSRRLDDAVKEMVAATVAEVESYLGWQQSG